MSSYVDFQYGQPPMDDRDEDSSRGQTRSLRGPARGRVWLNTGQFGDRDMEKDAYDGPHDTYTIKYDYRMRLRVKGELIGYIIHHGPFRVDLRDLGAPYSPKSESPGPAQGKRRPRRGSKGRSRKPTR